MRFAVSLLVAFACSGAFASQPGQPLDCADWVFDEPGHTCTQVSPYDCATNPVCVKGSNVQVDTQGRLLWTRQVQLPVNCLGAYLYEIQVVAKDLTNGIEKVVAHLADRCNVLADGGYAALDTAHLLTANRNTDPAVTFDPTNGRVLLAVSADCGNYNCWSCCNDYVGTATLTAIGGFATTLDILQTYTPQAALGFRVPYMPEGMAGADHFDTYWGPLAKPLDFTKAHSLACNYPATVPHVGDYLTVADTVPTPAPGQGVYYVTAATYQGTTRYGRKTTAGHQTGRDPAVLPACTP